MGGWGGNRAPASAPRPGYSEASCILPMLAPWCFSRVTSVFSSAKWVLALRQSRPPTLGMVQPFLHFLQQTNQYQETQTT